MDISFTKMHGLGNDFVIIEARNLPPATNLDTLGDLAAWVSERHFGIGADGLVVVAPPTDAKRYDSQFVYYNGDGSRAEMCGNGIRCFSRYLHDRPDLYRHVSGRPYPAEHYFVETPAGLIQPKVHEDGTVTVNMGPPILEPNRIPFAPETGAVPQNPPVLQIPITVSDKTLPVTPVSMGNPHCIIFQDDLPTAVDPAVFGPLIEKHPWFPAKTNVEFVEVLSPSSVRVTVWERGCGFTLACGTGACATAVAAHLCGKTESRVEVYLPGGCLLIEWNKEGSGDVMMTGPTTYVFHGIISIPDKTFSNLDVLNQQRSVLS